MVITHTTSSLLAAMDITFGYNRAVNVTLTEESTQFIHLENPHLYYVVISSAYHFFRLNLGVFGGFTFMCHSAVDACFEFVCPCVLKYTLVCFCTCVLLYGCV